MRTGPLRRPLLQQIEGLSGSDFAKQNSVGAVSQCGFQEVADGNGGRAVLLAPSFEADEVLVSKLDFCRVFDKQDAFVGWNEFSKCSK